MRHLILIRSAYGPSWDLRANLRRLDMTTGVTLRSLASQHDAQFGLVVLLHPQDPLLEQRRRVFSYFDATFLYLDAMGSPSEVAFDAYRAPWSDGIGPRDQTIAMTRLDDDDAFTPWAMAAVERVAEKMRGRAVLVFPLGVRVWNGGYTIVRHMTNAMHTLVTPPGDAMTVYDYGHRKLRRVAPVRIVDPHPAWLWARHPDTISGWRVSDRPLTPDIRTLFDVDWSLFGEARRQPKSMTAGGFVFR